MKQESEMENQSYDKIGVDYLNKLRDEVGKWSQHNFGDQLPWRPAMGAVEEIAELYEATEEIDLVKMADAVGDIVIYMADYYYRRCWDFGRAWSIGMADDLNQRTLIKLIGRLCHNHLKGDQGIRGGSAVQDEKMQQTCADTLHFLQSYCIGNFNRPLWEVVQDVWSVVGKRDWKKNPNNAHEVAEVAVKADDVAGVVEEVAVCAANLAGVTRLGLEGNPSYLEECKKNDQDPGDIFE